MPYGRLLKDLQELEQDEQAQDAIVRTIAAIGEAANRIQKVAAGLCRSMRNSRVARCVAFATRSQDVAMR